MSPGDAALADLYQGHATELNGFARRRVGRQEAEDVVQDTYLHLLQRGTAATLEPPRAYLFRIAANLRWISRERPRSVCITRAKASRSPAVQRLRPVPKPPLEA